MDIERALRDFDLADVASGFGVALRRDGREWEACCPFHAEDTPSFKIFTGKDGVQRFHCFGCGKRGDVVDFVAELKGVDTAEAVRILGGSSDRPNVKPRAAAEQTDPYAGIVPVEQEELRAGEWLRLYNPKRAGTDLEWGRFRAEAVYPYRLPDGRLFGHVLRRKLKDGGKETPMVMRVRLPSGEVCLSRFPFPKPRPLYRADQLTREQVFVVEGEKCADAFAAATGRCVVSWAGGTYGVGYADWQALAGRDVIIWPDADNPGRATARNIASALAGIAKRVRFIDVSDKSGGWDCADAVSEGVVRDKMDAFLRARVTVEAPAEEAEADPESEQEPAETGPEAGSEPAASEPQPQPPSAGANVVSLAVEQPEPEPRADWLDYALDESLPTGVAGVSLANHPERKNIVRLREWVFLRATSEFYNLRTAERVSKDSFNTFADRFTPFVEVKSGENVQFRKLTPSKTLLSYLGGLDVFDVMYAPHIPDWRFAMDRREYINGYLPSTVPAVDPDWKSSDAWKICQHHIETVFHANAKSLIQWLAHNVQRPGWKILWAPILIGIEGDGKTSVAKMLRSAMGARNVRDVSNETLVSDFNGWAEGACVCSLEEIRMIGERRSPIMNKLKPVITNERIEIHRKGRDGYEVINVTNYIAMSNHMDALLLSENDRRWCVMRTRFSTKRERDAVFTEEYKERLAWACTQNPGVIRGWLMSIDLSDFNSTIAPDTDAKVLMTEAARPATEADIREAIELGGEGVGEAVLSTDCLNGKLKHMTGKAVNTSALANILRDLGWTKYAPVLKWRGTARRVYYRPDLIEWTDDEKAMARKLRMALDDTLRDNGNGPEW